MTSYPVAIFVRDLSPTWMGKAHLFRIEGSMVPPHHVVVSAIHSAFGNGRPETYIFPADEDGTVLNWMERPGSQCGVFDIDSTIEGYIERLPDAMWVPGEKPFYLRDEEDDLTPPAHQPEPEEPRCPWACCPASKCDCTPEPATIKVVINRCYGGFSVSEAVYQQLGLEWDGYGYLHEWEDPDYISCDNLRSNPKLIAAIEAVGIEKASGAHADLRIVEVPADVKWSIVEYDGLEHVAEDHRTWC